LAANNAPIFLWWRGKDGLLADTPLHENETTDAKASMKGLTLVELLLVNQGGIVLYLFDRALNFDNEKEQFEDFKGSMANMRTVLKVSMTIVESVASNQPYFMHTLHRLYVLHELAMITLQALDLFAKPFLSLQSLLEKERVSTFYRRQ
jgi:hypothetical protein